MNAFSEFLSSRDAALPKLPWVHSTAGRHIGSVIEAEALTTARCPVFDEDLVYFFYGRPAYRPGDGDLVREAAYSGAVCFVVRPEALTAQKRAYPFDTGAYPRYSAEGAPAAGLALDDFRLDSPDLVPHVVGAFFGTNRRYYHGESLADVEAGGAAARAFHQMLRAEPAGSADEGWDDRGYSAEAQVPEDVRLSGNLLVVVMPRALLERSDVREAMKRWDAEPLGYPTFHRGRVRDFHGAVWRELLEFFEEDGSYFG
jgi:hypothetical protein